MPIDDDEFVHMSIGVSMWLELLVLIGSKSYSTTHLCLDDICQATHSSCRAPRLWSTVSLTDTLRSLRSQLVAVAIAICDAIMKRDPEQVFRSAGVEAKTSKTIPVLRYYVVSTVCHCASSKALIQ